MSIEFYKELFHTCEIVKRARYLDYPQPKYSAWLKKLHDLFLPEGAEINMQKTNKNVIVLEWDGLEIRVRNTFNGLEVRANKKTTRNIPLWFNDMDVTTEELIKLKQETLRKDNPGTGESR